MFSFSIILILKYLQMFSLPKLIIFSNKMKSPNNPNTLLNSTHYNDIINFIWKYGLKIYELPRIPTQVIWFISQIK